MAVTNILKKNVFTEADFDQMTWHDCPIYGISFTDDNRLLIDIDYIFEWVLQPNKRYWKFWIAPCTLVFENVYKVALETDHTNVIIDNVIKDNPQVPKNADCLTKKIEYDWLIETTVGEISFVSVGFNQYVRMSPVLQNNQKLDLQSRGGLSFDIAFSSQS